MKETQALHNDLVSGKLTDMPPIPSIKKVWLQFFPNNAVVSAAGKMTGLFNLCCHIQVQTLKKQHDDQHWLNAFIKYQKH